MALLVKARDLLEGLADTGRIEPGSPPECTLGYIDDAIGMLSPFDDDD